MSDNESGTTTSARRPVRVLLVEDNPGDVRLVREALRDTHADDLEVSDVGLVADARKRLLAEAFDVVLLDLGLPDGEGLDMVSELTELVPEAPIVVLTGRNDEDIAIQAVRAGASDYLIKGTIDGKSLVRSVRYAIERHRLVTGIKRQNRQLEQCAFAPAHDAKAPPGTVERKIELLLYELGVQGVPPEMHESLDGIQLPSERMRRLVTDFLVLGRAGSRAEEIESVQISVLAQSVVEWCRERADAAGVTILVDVAADLPVVPARPRDIEATLENLIGNALESLGETVDPKVSVYAEATADLLRVCVQDNGPGFDPAQAEKVFEPYQRLDSQREGTGLGLAIVKKAVDGHGGTTWIETAAGTGTAVWFTLPLASDRDTPRS